MGIERLDNKEFHREPLTDPDVSCGGDTSCPGEDWDARRCGPGGEIGAAGLPEELEADLRASVERFRKRQLVAASLLVLLSGAMMLAGLLSSGGYTEELAAGRRGLSLVGFLRIGGAAMLALGLIAVAVVLRRAAVRRRVLEAAVGRPQEVAWVFLESVGILDYGGDSGLVLRPHLQLRDGTHAWFQVSKGRAREVFEFYERENPTVCLGYSRELRKRLKSDPEGLSLNPVRTREVKHSRVTFIPF